MHQVTHSIIQKKKTSFTSPSACLQNRSSSFLQLAPSVSLWKDFLVTRGGIKVVGVVIDTQFHHEILTSQRRKYFLPFLKAVLPHGLKDKEGVCYLHLGNYNEISSSFPSLPKAILVSEMRF